MSKVLVDRDLLEKHVSEIDSWNASMEKIIGKQPDYRWASLETLREALAQPAEAEGVEVVGVIDEADEGCFVELMDDRSFRLGEKLVRQSDHLAALSAMTAERDRLQRNLNFTEQWYAVRFERLTDLGKAEGFWHAMAAIIANGTADSHEPPTYARQLVRANHRADVAEAELDQLRAEVEALRTVVAQSVEYLDVSSMESICSGSVIHQRLRAAMAAKEA